MSKGNHFQLSMGSYLRRLRLDWAARELVRSDASLTAVALAAGFADQSHFTRFFKRHAGSPRMRIAGACGTKSFQPTSLLSLFNQPG